MLFSVYSLLSLGLAALATAEVVFTNRTGGPVFSPGNNIVPVGLPYPITWSRDTQGTVSIILLNHVNEDKPVGQDISNGWRSIVLRRANTGVFMWTPDISIAPYPTGYVIRVVDDDTGNFQSTAPFGISNPNYINTTSTVASSSATPTVSSASNVKSVLLILNGTTTSTSTLAPYANATVTNSAQNATPTAPYPMTASGGAINSTVIQPTGSTGVPTSLLTATSVGSGPSPTANSPPAAASTTRPASAAGKLGATCGGALLGLAAIVAFIL
ncbi:MAG: hypothetical protein M1836_006804 [Candelina mexicana]|nr:MAG: hypothetical protein M1836_006804 [Candelina mexicana]